MYFFNKLIFVITMMMTVVFLPKSASADLIYSLTSTVGPGGSRVSGSSPYGTIDISSVNSNTVQVTVTLNGSVRFSQQLFPSNSVLLNLATGSPDASTLSITPSAASQSIQTNQTIPGGNQLDIGISLGTFASTFFLPGTFTFDLSTSSNLGLTPQDFYSINTGSTYYAAIQTINANGNVYFGATTASLGLPEPSTYITLGSLLVLIFACQYRRITATKKPFKTT